MPLSRPRSLAALRPLHNLMHSRHYDISLDPNPTLALILTVVLILTLALVLTLVLTPVLTVTSPLHAWHEA